MFDWLRHKITFHLIVTFREETPRRISIAAALDLAGVRRSPGEIAPSDGAWTWDLAHPEWGRAILERIDQAPVAPEPIVRAQPGLAEADIRDAMSSRSAVIVRMEAAGDNVLHEKKQALRLARAVMGDAGLVLLDPSTMRIWTRADLDDELSHDADLDIEALYNIHVVNIAAEGEKPELWLHTHGLAAIGAVDFDVLRPSAVLCSFVGSELLRALASAILEKRVDTSVPSFALAYPGGDVALVDVAEFTRKADRYLATRVRDPADESHNRDRVVVCEPRGGFLSRWFDRVRPSRFLAEVEHTEILIHFSKDATAVMADRAQRTYGYLRRLAGELAPFDVKVAVKLGYELDRDAGEEDTEESAGEDREHLWFEVHAMLDDVLDATLVSEPIHITRMKAGDRGMHPLERMSDWHLFTPAGIISPRWTAAVRILREKKDEILAAMKAESPVR